MWSVTSWNELYRDGGRADEHNYLHPEREPQVAYVTRKLSGRPGPVVAVSDFMRAVQDQIRGWVPSDYYTLGADGFGFSDTRPAARRHLHIDGQSIVVRTLQALADRGELGREVVGQAIESTGCTMSMPSLRVRRTRTDRLRLPGSGRPVLAIRGRIVRSRFGGIRDRWSVPVPGGDGS